LVWQENGEVEPFLLLFLAFALPTVLSLAAFDLIALALTSLYFTFKKWGS
jgi:hypothetical protein